mmetsp:Transcript_40374/g.73130  ORF Transcript_40374/g.73130 Transcript_40374/m.73130 type:complete len:283 (-) Transcript_40374:305-1153(-)
MAVYFDMPTEYHMNNWNRDNEQYLWDDADGSADAWGRPWSTKENWAPHRSWNNLGMKPEQSYDPYAAPAGWRRPAPMNRGIDSWETAMAMYQSLHEEPNEILVVNSTSSGAYASLCRDAATADVVGFDAEWQPDFEYGSDNPIATLQFAFPASRMAYVIQLGPLGRKLPQEVQMMLVNPEVLKVGFAVNYKDSEKLERSGIAVTKGSIVDVQESCAVQLGIGWGSAQSLSLRRCANELLGSNLMKDKRCQCSDWSNEQLTPEQVHYAALDAWVALRLYYLPA